MRTPTPVRFRNRTGCDGDVSNFPKCICCSDEAVAAKVLVLLPDGMALVELNGAIEEVSVELTEAAAGDVVLVHAKTAIARVSGTH